ncbi:MAG TPA: hypothetical protein VK211_23800 [Kamptonema sp.]|nr:hypothetical protein [Kamptonema sp.]
MEPVFKSDRVLFCQHSYQQLTTGCPQASYSDIFLALIALVAFPVILGWTFTFFDFKTMKFKKSLKSNDNVVDVDVED